jgi:hypothetical protein
MNDFKQSVMTFQMKIHSPTPLPDPKNLGIYMMTKIIPHMEGAKDVAFAWHWKANDVVVYDQSEYDTETTSYRKKGLKADKGDTPYFYDYTFKGKKRRCILTSEIWYKDDEDFRTSPFAFLFGQFFGSGLHITRVRFENQPPTCCLCDQKCECPYGNNPAPVAEEGVCCDECNRTKVIPARIAEMVEAK